MDSEKQAKWRDAMWVGVVLVAVAVFMANAIQGRATLSGKNMSREQLRQAEAIGQWIGERSADTVLIEFSDFECPFCREIHPLLSEWSSKPGRAIIYLHYPLPQHPFAREAALAALCTSSALSFIGVHDSLLTTTGWQHPGGAQSLVVQYDGRPSLEVENCVRSNEANSRLDGMLALSRDLDVGQTPTFYLGGRLIPTPRSITELETIVSEGRVRRAWRTVASFFGQS